MSYTLGEELEYNGTLWIKDPLSFRSARHCVLHDVNTFATPQ